MQDDLINIRIRVPFSTFATVFKDFAEVPQEISGFSDEEVVYRFIDCAGNPAFMVRRVGEDMVNSFGVVLLDRHKLALLRV